MRVALVSPYSWTYGGGVNGHVADLAEELGRRHDVRILAPWDPPDRITRVTHRGAPQRHPMPENLVPLGRSFALNGNGSVSNLAWSPTGMVKLRRALAAEPFDVVHVHEPIAPFIGPDTCSWRGAPVIGTFHAYSTNPITNNLGNLAGVRRKLNQLHARIAVSEAAAWTGRRWFGGEYTVIPNGVDLTAPPREPKPRSADLRVLFVGRPEERKGLPILLRAFEALVEHVPARLTVVGADAEDLARYLPDPDTASRIDALGRVPDDELWAQLHGADVLCAPSLAGESFGMILTEAFAAGTPVVASRIAGYSDVVTDGVDGVLVPPADAQALAEELQRLHHEPERRERMGAAARRSAERYAWPRVASEVETVYERALEVPEPAGARERIGRRLGLLPAAGGPNIRPQRLPSLDPAPAGSGRHRMLRRLGLGVAGAAGVGLTAIAAQKIGVDSVLTSIVRSDLSWVLFAVALMMFSMFLRAGSWFSIARSALPSLPLRRRDVTSATMIGVLMSATLPARLGEPARAMVLARHSGGRMRETFPVLLGTLVSQSVLNIVALVLLGVAHRWLDRPLPHQHREALPRVDGAPRPTRRRRPCADPRPPQRQRADRPHRRRDPRGPRPGALRPPRLPRPAPWLGGGGRPARRLGDPAHRLLRAARGHGPRVGRHRRRRGGPIRGQRHRGRTGDSLEHRRLPAGRDQRPHHRFRRLRRRRPRLRRDPAGGRGRDRRHPRPARPRPRGNDVVRHAGPGALGRSRAPCATRRYGCGLRLRERKRAGRDAWRSVATWGRYNQLLVLRRHTSPRVDQSAASRNSSR